MCKIEKWTEARKTHAVLNPGAAATEAELLELCRSQLADYNCPKSVVFLDSLPKTGSGNILKRELRGKHWPGQKVARGQRSRG
jgi:acyl-CoA synthetase (AMP-forming)/AMP-acid ligase II